MLANITYALLLTQALVVDPDPGWRRVKFSPIISPTRGSLFFDAHIDWFEECKGERCELIEGILNFFLNQVS